ncbi:hypothetical protein BJP40_16625 [Streptomyces sp. CC53]|uniref:hypothetical protein n=1 Tax=Streptomyces sp. CC53 TaxID=1906740 RepID=UPI0008DE7EC3|nr:hypothetical protein [Streptomyces sp. CC53]OII65495.1 hypothetical protein BJP40_16625 [Streptomyces sp. CC53]
MRVTRTGSAGVRASALLGLALVTGCTAVGSGGGLEPAGPRLRAQAEPSREAVSTGGLAALTLAQGDVAGHTVREPAPDERVEQRDVEADGPCRALAHVLAGAAAGDPSGATARRVVGSGTATSVLLATHEGQGGVDAAQASVAAVNRAADECAGGFAYRLGDREQRITEVTREVAPRGADQAVAFGVRMEKSGTPARGRVILLRKGSSIAYITALGTDRSAAVPAEVVEAQLVKLS